ncbi:hypothetical protein Cgig2_000605 [Carnegiea gigantea]|uniref:Uncharacterized protein n=1 Tax=Carnegiea gigantea TaxID=171969 RepID=A0A9Q1GXX6_9CARY|nr:hypothetical protein Cgig2_000605 [Carnegiea gigantea]
MKVANAIVQRIFIDVRSSVDIIIWDCLKKLKHPGREIVHLVHPILGFGGKNDKTKTRNLEVDFLVVDVPLAYNVILGRATLHKAKVVIVSYLLQLQYEVDDGSIGKLQGDEWMARECYLVSIQPLVERTIERGPMGPLPSDKKPRTTPPPPAKTLVIHTLALVETEQPCPEAVDGIEKIPLDEECLILYG